MVFLSLSPGCVCWVSLEADVTDALKDQSSESPSRMMLLCTKSQPPPHSPPLSFPCQGDFHSNFLSFPVTCYLTRITHPESWAHHSNSSSINPRFRLRWFSPTIEVKLCGHATLAASHFLFTSGLVNGNEIEFMTLSGVLTAKRIPEVKQTHSLNLKNNSSEESQDCFSIELDFPVVPLVESDSSAEEELLSISKALNVASVIDFKKTGAQDHIVVLGLGKSVADAINRFRASLSYLQI